MRRDALKAYFNVDYLTSLLQSADPTSWESGQILWPVLNFGLWHHYWIEGERIEELVERAVKPRRLTVDAASALKRSTQRRMRSSVASVSMRRRGPNSPCRARRSGPLAVGDERSYTRPTAGTPGLARAGTKLVFASSPMRDEQTVTFTDPAAGGDLRISVAMATWNGERFVGEQLESIARQSRLPDEVVLSDDASADRTLEIARAFARKAPFDVVVLGNDERVGHGENFFRAMRACKGDVIALSDQDDV